MTEKNIVTTANTAEMTEEYWPFWDDFMFMMVMQDAKLCADFLKMVLPEEEFAQVKVRPQGNPLFNDPELDASNFTVETVETQKTMKFHHDKHGVRLDVLAKGAAQWADIEMQVWSEKYIGKRARYYRCNMDLEQLDAGGEYADLKKSIIIFICKGGDPVGADEPVYYFQSWDANLGLKLKDDAITIILNITCSPEKVPEGLNAFYAYMNDPTKSDGSQLVRDIEKRVQRYNSSEWRTRKMRFDELRKQEYIKGLAEGKELGLAEGEKIGLEKGREEATERLGKLYRRLRADGRLDDYDRAVEDDVFRQQLFEEFGL